jgi:hypothetical protein
MTTLSSPLVKDNDHIIKMFLNITNCQNNKHDTINQNSIMNIKGALSEYLHKLDIKESLVLC